MGPTDAWQPLIAFFGIFTGAATSPLLALLVVALVACARRPWQVATGLPTLAVLDAAFVHATESEPPSWPLLAAGEGLAVLAQGIAAGLVVEMVRNQWRKERLPPSEGGRGGGG